MSARRVVRMRIVSENERVMPCCGVGFELTTSSFGGLLERALEFRLRREELVVMIRGM